MNYLLRPSPARLTKAIARLRAAAVTYPEVGATQSELPAGYDHLRRRARLGHGSATFTAAVTAVRTWELHRRAGLVVAASAASVDPGTVVVVGLRVGVVWFLAPCRVVWITDHPDRWGFGYGTLPGHPECGEEAFVIERDDEGAVWLTLTAFSRPAWLLTRVLGPLARRQQRQIADAYLRALDGT
jgi:uncharacterized protein (UPF0548 family)